MEDSVYIQPAGMARRARDELSPIVIPLLRGVVYRDEDPRHFASLVALQARLRDYVAVLDLELELDESEGYAFLRSRPAAEIDIDGDPPADGDDKLPRLIVRRQLPFHTSLLLALLRRKLLELDAGGGSTRLVVGRNAIVDMMRVFLPEATNEARVIDQIDRSIERVVELGFVRKLKDRDGSDMFEVRRILKAFVDAQWVADFTQRLEEYRALAKEKAGANSEA
jgi:hypothetical protein